MNETSYSIIFDRIHHYLINTKMTESTVYEPCTLSPEDMVEEKEDVKEEVPDIIEEPKFATLPEQKEKKDSKDQSLITDGELEAVLRMDPKSKMVYDQLIKNGQDKEQAKTAIMKAFVAKQFLPQKKRGQKGHLFTK